MSKKKNVNGNQQTTDSLFHLQSLKVLVTMREKKKKKHKALIRAVCWNSTYLPLAVIDLFFTYKLYSVLAVYIS